MTFHETKAGDWLSARTRGERLPEHELPQEHCDLCNGPACEHDYCDAAGMFVCPTCLEAHL